MHLPDYLAALKEELRNHKALGLDAQAKDVETEIKRVEAAVKRDTAGPKEKAVPAVDKETTKDES